MIEYVMQEIGRKNYESEAAHPNEILTLSTDHYVIKALDDLNLDDQRISEKHKAALLNYPLKSNPSVVSAEEDKNKVFQLARLQLRAYKNGSSIRSESKQLTSAEISIAPQALLFFSYRHLFSNLTRIVLGEKEFGYQKELDRTQPENAIASGLMAAGAITSSVNQQVIPTLAKLGQQSTFIQLGAGDGMFTRIVAEKCHERDITPPLFVVSDLNKKTQIVAKNNLEKAKLREKKDFKLIKADMSDSNDLKNLRENSLNGPLFLQIGYILHENRNLAQKTLANIAEVFKNREVYLVLSEYYKQEVVGSNVPVYFEFIHSMTQELFEGRDNFLNFVSNSGMTHIEELEVTHATNNTNQEIMNSTTIWKL